MLRVASVGDSARRLGFAARFPPPVSPPNRAARAIPFRRFIFGEFHEVATLREIRRGFPFVRPATDSWPAVRAKIPRWSVPARENETAPPDKRARVRNQDEKRLRLRDQRQRFLQFLLRANMRRNGRRRNDLVSFRNAKIKSSPQRRPRAPARRRHQTHSQPLNFHRRLDVAELVLARRWHWR